MTSAVQASTYFSPFFSLFVCLLSETTRRNSLGLEHARDAIAPTTATFIRKQKNINVHEYIFTVKASTITMTTKQCQQRQKQKQCQC